jgi:plasmid stabilization system protein ParE
MNWHFELENEAEVDFWKAFEFYANIDLDIGDRFIQDFDRAVDQICQFPESSPIIDGSCRRKLLDKFPHYIVFDLIEPLSSTLFGCWSYKKKTFFLEREINKRYSII